MNAPITPPMKSATPTSGSTSAPSGGRGADEQGRSERDVEGVGLAADWIAHRGSFRLLMTKVFPLRRIVNVQRADAVGAAPGP